MIEGLSFAPGDSRILVTRLTGRDARTPFKLYKADVARTISWLDASTGDKRGILLQDFKPGNCGPAFQFWRVGRTSALCSPSSNQVSMSAFGGGDVACILGIGESKGVPLQHPALNIAYSKSGRFLAASGRDGVTVIDTHDNSTAMLFQASDLSFLGASLMSFTNDDTRIVVAGNYGVHLWEIATTTQRSTVFAASEPTTNAVAVLSDDNVIVSSDEWVRRYDLNGQLVATLAENGGYLCSASRDGTRLAVATDGQLTIYDLRSNKTLRSLPSHGTTALALTSDGDALAVGDYHGCVALIDTATGARRWYAEPPGRYRWPWTIPAAFLVAWAYAVRRLSRRTSSSTMGSR